MLHGGSYLVELRNKAHLNICYEKLVPFYLWERGCRMKLVHQPQGHVNSFEHSKGWKGRIGQLQFDIVPAFDSILTL